MDKWSTSIVIQEKKTGNQFIKTEETNIITTEQIKAQKEFQDQIKKLNTDINDIQERLREIKRNDNKVRRFVESFSGKSKLDLFWEKRTNTPRKVKLLKNRGIKVMNQEYFDERKENITKDILFYLKKYQI